MILLDDPLINDGVEGTLVKTGTFLQLCALVPHAFEAVTHRTVPLNPGPNDKVMELVVEDPVIPDPVYVQLYVTPFSNGTLNVNVVFLHAACAPVIAPGVFGMLIP